jgi:hypothetical protein
MGGKNKAGMGFHPPEYDAQQHVVVRTHYLLHIGVPGE